MSTGVCHLSCQAEFATSAVDYLHRIGRTARAGRTGKVTSLYTEANADLVRAIRDAVDAGQPVVRMAERGWEGCV